jgi:hypothetical protein
VIINRLATTVLTARFRFTRRFTNLLNIAIPRFFLLLFG